MTVRATVDMSSVMPANLRTKLNAYREERTKKRRQAVRVSERSEFILYFLN